VDIIRIDHFRGFEKYFEIPGNATTAVNGRWVSGPGNRLFEVLRQALGTVRFIAEDLGYITPEVKVLAIAKEPGGEYVLPSVETVDSGTYPIARDLFMYTNGEPTGLVKDYLDWILSPEAQDIVRELGFVPVGDEGLSLHLETSTGQALSAGRAP
jgi:ABC-type phosphate transport system substrate-binding protein